MNDHLQICPFPENKPAMLSFTFDDGTLDHLETAAPELEKRGWRGTFYINPQSNNRPPEKLLDWNGIRELYRRGHEIGNHTMSHCHPSKWETTKRYDLLAWEIAESQRQFSEHLGMRPKSYTAPFGARCEFISSLLAANNLLETPRRISIVTETTPADFAEIKRQALQPGTFTVLVNHGVVPGYGGWAPVSKEFFVDMLNEWKAVEDQIHIGPFAESESYRRRAQNTILTEIAGNAFLLRLKPEASFLYGPVYLRKTNPDMQIFVNLLPVLPDKDGVFRVYPGSVIELK